MVISPGMRQRLIPLLVAVAGGISGMRSVAVAETLPISLSDNRVFIQARVDGAGPYRFLVDTGSSETTIDLNLAKRLAKRAGLSGHASGAGEQSVRYARYHLDSLRIGSVRLGPMDVPAIDYAPLARTVGMRPFDGVLGAELFEKRVVTIDSRNRLLTFSNVASFRPRSNAIRLRIVPDADGVPIAGGSVNGVAGRFMIDTGDRSWLTLYGPFWRRNDVERTIRPDVVAMTGYGIGGPIRSIVGRCQSCTLGSHLLADPVTRLSLQRAGSSTRSDVEGSVGMGILRRFVLSFDYAHQRMWLVPTPAIADDDRYDRSGVWLAIGDLHHFEIEDIVIGGPAARSGLRRGDIITAIDGIAANPQTLAAVRELLRRPRLKHAIFHAVQDGQRLSFDVALRDLIAASSLDAKASYSSTIRASKASR